MNHPTIDGALPCARLVGQADLPKGDKQQDKGHSHQQSARDLFARLDNALEPVAQGRGRGGQTGGKAPTVSCGTQDKFGVLPPLPLPQTAQHRLVAAELQVFRASPHGQPHEGVKPAHGNAKCNKELVPGILPANMHQFVAEDELQLLRGVVPLGQHHPHAFEKQADGNGRGGLR